MKNGDFPVPYLKVYQRVAWRHDRKNDGHDRHDRRGWSGRVLRVGPVPLAADFRGCQPKKGEEGPVKETYPLVN